MKPAAVLVVCACRGPNPPAQPVAPLPPEPGPEQPPADAMPVSSWPAFPKLDGAPASHPTGDPISVPGFAVKIGDVEHQTITSTFEQHYTHAATTRYQLTETTFDL